MKNSQTPANRQRKSSRLKKIFIRTGIAAIGIFLLVFLAFKFSPWPSSLLIRYAFTKGAVKASDALAKHVPDGISQILEQQYDAKDKDAFLDVYYPSAIANTERQLPVIVWIHGGGWVSGRKEDIANYCKILAGKGYTTVSVDYSIAPEKQYPTPLKQINIALAYMVANAKRLHIDTTHFFLAGDSGGAHIAAQTGSIISNSDYARLLNIMPGIKLSQLSGLILYCGPYDAEHINLNGGFGSFLRSILWAYMGKKDFTKTPLFKTFSVINYIDSNFPPSFISAGNGDPLHTQSETLARKLALLNVQVDTLFFAPDYVPSLPHEYQFNMDIDAGKEALSQSLVFLDKVLYNQ
ncbi:alpha/beta hydrolase [Parapedobacter koreensis]|uniref:Acetyl esterase/lipase n=1 Tax=Parapedobacter koreensis TaxID=332977 RepID=A0A1H7MRZ3_9SPHI|nr:alpha/beta hydrolase [Parapedobacter koreensis]SEL13578.1 Acetyl esterase/lipase [Parapedobacter koreensis]